MARHRHPTPRVRLETHREAQIPTTNFVAHAMVRMEKARTAPVRLSILHFWRW